MAVVAKRKVVKTFCFRTLRFDLAILTEEEQIRKWRKDPRDALLHHDLTPAICTLAPGTSLP
jgi:hypothetical protein